MCDIMTNKYKVFVIDRLDRYSYCDNYKAVVVAEDVLHAEKICKNEY